MNPNSNIQTPFTISMNFAEDWRPEQNNVSSLDEYLESRKNVIQGNDSGGKADWENYHSSLDKHLKRIDKFLLSGERNMQNLVYGNIQSGKTAHLLANICWAKDKGFDLVILLSGSTTPLNDQTYARLKADLPSGTARIDMVPTETLTLALNDLSTDLMTSITNRLTNSGQVIPIVVMLKNPNRLGAMVNLIENLNSRFNKDLTVMVIDDEADQGGPDATQRTSRPGAGPRRSIHQSISNLLQRIQGKIIYLAYTATPQALLVGEIQNQLHPRYCTVIPSGRDYVGIKEIVTSNNSMFDNFTLSGTAVGTPEDVVNNQALQKMFMEFLVLSYIHREHPQIFHKYEDGTVGICNRNSIQFLIHPSAAQSEHIKYFEWVKEIRESWTEMLNSPLHKKRFISQLVEPSYSSVLSRLAFEEQEILMSPENQIAFMNSFHKSISPGGPLEIRLVNSDERTRMKRIGIEREFLPDDERGEWDGRDWVLIGGDILGRGLTIPHLTTTVFLRDPNRPNFDVGMQQMRFLGYRKSYERLLRVCAPQSVLDDYRDAAVISTLSRRRAEMWDKTDRDLIENPDPIIFQAPQGARYSPTRNQVTSVEVAPKDIGNSGFFSFGSIVNPENFDQNLSCLSTLIRSNKEMSDEQDWTVIKLTSEELLQELKTFSVSRQDKIDFEPFLELLSFESDNFGLAEKDCYFVVDKQITTANLMNFRETIDIRNFGMLFGERTRSIFLGTNLSGTNELADKWKNARDTEDFDNLRVKAIVGDSERNVGRFEPDSVRVHARIFGLYVDAASRTNPIGWGLSLIGWTPLSGTRMWIHQGAISD